MGTSRRVAHSALIAALEEDARGFSFFEAVDLIEAHCPACVPVGYRGPAAREAVRFVGNPSLAFPTADLERIAAPTGEDGDTPYRMMVNFLGLYGQGSPLPLWYTEEVLHPELDEHAVKDFLDLFVHRLVSLFRRCGTKYRYYREFRPGGADPTSQWLFALMGVLHPALREGTALDWQRLLPYAGIIAMRHHSAPMLRGVLSHYLGVPVAIDEFIPELAPIAEEQWACLGQCNCELGEDLTLGEYVPDCAGRIRVRIGPLDFAGFNRFLPAGEEWEPSADWVAAHDLVALLVIDPLRCDFELVLRADAIPPLLLGAPDCRLGWSTWLGGSETDGAVLFPDAGALGHTELTQ